MRKNNELNNELFNVAGDKLSIIEKVLKKERMRLELEEAPPERIKYSYIRTQNDLKEKRFEYLQTRLYESIIRPVNKFTILGDEVRLRNELILGFPVNSRDATVSFYVDAVIYCGFILAPHC